MEYNWTELNIKLLAGCIIQFWIGVKLIPCKESWRSFCTLVLCLQYAKWVQITSRQRVAGLPALGCWSAPVLRIRNVYPGSRIRLFSIPDPGSELSPSRIPDPGSSKNLSILTPKKAKKWFLSSKKYDPGCSSRIPDPDADFLPSWIPDPGVKKVPNPGSRIRIRNTGSAFILLAYTKQTGLWLVAHKTTPTGLPGVQVQS